MIFRTLFYMLKLVFKLIAKDNNLIIKNIALQYQLEILSAKQKKRNRRIIIDKVSKLFLVFLNSVSEIKDSIKIVKPETLLKWQNNIIKANWTFKRKNKPGRKPIPAFIKNIILEMKNSNLLWGLTRIRGELKKLDINLSEKSISNILNTFRKNGKVRKTFSWSRFLKAHAESIIATDFFTVNTIFNRTYYVLFFISHKTRKIIHYAVCDNPSKLFVKNHVKEMSYSIKQNSIILHDNGHEFFIDYEMFGLKGIRTSVKAPNMNAFAERFVRSVRNEALDNFIIISKYQLRNILKKYIKYYNDYRPHQGIENTIPSGNIPQLTGEIRSLKILDGLHTHYYRKAA